MTYGILYPFYEEKNWTSQKYILYFLSFNPMSLYVFTSSQKYRGEVLKSASVF